MTYPISIKVLRMFHFTLLIHSHSNSLPKLVFLSLVLFNFFFFNCSQENFSQTFFKILMVTAFAGVIQRVTISNFYCYTGWSALVLLTLQMLSWSAVAPLIPAPSCLLLVFFSLTVLQSNIQDAGSDPLNLWGGKTKKIISFWVCSLWG